MGFTKDEISEITVGISDLDAGKIKVVCQFLQEIRVTKGAGFDTTVVSRLLDTEQMARMEPSPAARAKVLVGCFDEVNALRVSASRNQPVSESDQIAVANKLTNILAGFPTTVWEQRARNLLEIAEDRRWTRSEFKEAQGYTDQNG